MNSNKRFNFRTDASLWFEGNRCMRVIYVGRERSRLSTTRMWSCEEERTSRKIKEQRNWRGGLAYLNWNSKMKWSFDSNTQGSPQTGVLARMIWHKALKRKKKRRQWKHCVGGAAVAGTAKWCLFSFFNLFFFNFRFLLIIVSTLSAF